MKELFDNISAEISLLIGMFTLVGLVLGSRAIPGLVAWFKGVIDALIYPFTGTRRSVALLIKQHEEFNEKLTYLIEQTKPNGGTSLKDGLNRIEQKQASMAARMEVIMTFSNPMYETDAEGRCVWVSSSYAHKVNKSVDSLLGWGWISIIHPDDLHRVRDTWNSCIKDERDFQGTFRVLSDGQIFEILSTAHPIKVNGKVTGWVGAWQDIGGQNG